ncbi:MAG TPA: glycosyltransferase family 4 protein [Solirubrobacteraceae bacterium]|jgi:glycosyltransferase involved in cell wall biosynthesis|nr:glycosyltransferase family 4 protein [Solirubrobacteraceae bacterium]
MAAETETGARGDAVRSAALPDVTIVANDIGPVGGMERQLTDLIAGLRALGHHVTVIARTCELPAGVEVEFHRVIGPGRPFVLAHTWFLLAGSLVTRRYRRGILQVNGAVVFNRADIAAVHYCHQVGPANASRSGRLFEAHVKLARVLKRRSEGPTYALNDPAVFVGVSEGVAEEMREHHPRFAGRVVAIHNGIDTGAFAPGVHAEAARSERARLELAPDALTVAFVGSEWGRKGLEPVIRALADAPAWTLLVAGAGDRERYEELARTLGVASRVRFLGVRSDVAVVYEAADAFVLPSSYETFSIVTFEAAASALPVLATAVSGVRELVRDGENGYLITPDADVISDRLNRLAADAELRARLGAAARESALGFDSERMVRRYHELYERLAAEGRVAA